MRKFDVPFIVQTAIVSSILFLLLKFFPLDISLLIVVGSILVSLVSRAGTVAIVQVLSIFPLLYSFGIFGIFPFILLGLTWKRDSGIAFAFPFLYSTFLWPAAFSPGLSTFSKMKNFVPMFFFSSIFMFMGFAATRGSLPGIFSPFSSSLSGISSVTPSSISSALSASIKASESNYSILSSYFTGSLIYALGILMAIASAISWVLFRYIMGSESKRKNSSNYIGNAIASVSASSLAVVSFFLMGVLLFPSFGLKFTMGISDLVYAVPVALGLSLLYPYEMKSKDIVTTGYNMVKEENPTVTAIKSAPIPSDVLWDKIYDMKDTKETLLSIASDISDGDRCYGIILFGPPGTGKTSISKALAGKLGWRFYETKFSDYMSFLYGEAERNLEKMFMTLFESTPCVCFFDEIEGIMGLRDRPDVHESTHRLVNIFLTRLQEAHDRNLQILFIGATNLPNDIDESFLRPGRFDEVIYVPLPDLEGRKEIWQGILGPGFNYEEIAKRSERYSPADIKAVYDQVVRRARKDNTEISDRTLLAFLNTFKPSVRPSTLTKFDDLSRKYSSKRLDTVVSGVEDVKWEDIGGLESVKEELKSSIEIPLKHKDVAETLKIRPARGILLYGPPGTGKTMIAKAVANELSLRFFQTSGDELSRAGPYGAADLIRDKFNTARDNSPAVMFIDEVDSLARSRISNEWRSALTQLLTEMDGLTSFGEVIVLGATNTPWDLDPAILRSGRFEKCLYVFPPDLEGRKDVLKKLLEGLTYDESLISKIAEETDLTTPSDLKLLVDNVRRQLLSESLSSGNVRSNISMEDISPFLKNMKRSVNPEMLELYKRFADEHPQG